jgi:hypothetical protein
MLRELKETVKIDIIRRTSKLGTASIIFFTICMICFIIMFATDNINLAANLILLIIFFNIVGLEVGIIGLTKKNRDKLLPIIGVALNSILSIILLILFIKY